MWGGIVGKSRALSDLESLIHAAGSRKLLSEDIQLSEYSLKLLEKRFKALPDKFESTNVNENYKFIEGEKCQLEEDLLMNSRKLKVIAP